MRPYLPAFYAFPWFSGKGLFARTTQVVKGSHSFVLLVVVVVVVEGEGKLM